MVAETGDELLHEDELCTCRARSGQILVAPHRPFASWWDATIVERNALLSAIELGRDHLRTQYPDRLIHIAWSEPPVGGSELSHLRIRLTIGSAEPAAIADLGLPSALDRPPHLRGLIHGDDDPLLPHLAYCFPRAEQVDIAVAFVFDRGVRCLRPYLEDLLARGKRLRLITGDYCGVTEPNGLESLLDLDGLRDLRVFQTGGKSFHPKSYLFHLAGGEGIAFVGSSNLSQLALGNGVEWNYRVLRSRDDDGFASACAAFDRLLQHPNVRPLTHQWVDAYRATREPDAARQQGALPEEEPPPPPHEIQERALAALQETRDDDNVAGLVVLATGLGKTWLSAFDSRSFRRVLFVAHREEILDQARKTFRRIRPEASLGIFNGTEKTPDADVLFASVQTLGRVRHLRDFAPDHFDYIIVDEFHHAAARTYRGLIEHFTPRFLLGLTATPERTDGADLLTLCGNNLVFSCGLADGVRSGLLSPFAYYGVPDDVDYDQIPWRSTRFDEEELTKALATQRRAQNALEQHAQRGGRRTLGFCASQRHADFMAGFFDQNGVRAVAVHSGTTSAPRANALAALGRGELDVVFSVDMFNEGVDLPNVDTVMMLRPTESRILWLQQFGRGLRKAEGKDHLRVIDYIGNHRSFLDKPRALLGSLLAIGDDHDALRMALRRLQAGDADLPPGCSVTYDLEAIEILERLLRPTSAQDELRAAYLEFRERHGRRPTATELHAGGSLTRNTLRTARSSWFDYVNQMGDLGDAEKSVIASHGAFIREIEKSKMERSYKMLLLQAMLECHSLPGFHSIVELAERFRRIAHHSPRLRQELETTLADGQNLVSMVRENPMRAWAGTKRGGGSHYFSIDGDRFGTKFDIAAEHKPAFVDLVGEIVDWRLAEYVDRSTGVAFECRVTHNERNSIIMLPDRERTPGLPEGSVQVHAEGENFDAQFVKIAVNVLRRRSGNRDENVLPDLLRYWFGEGAAQKGTRDRVRFLAEQDGYRLTPVARRSGVLPVLSLDGTALDAHFLVESIGQRMAIIYMSRGGTRGSAAERNSDYTPGLDALLTRACQSGLVLTEALLDSKPARETPRGNRRLRLEGTSLPLDLGKVTDVQQLRRSIAKAQREMGGNETRQLRLVLDGHGQVDPNHLGTRLAGVHTKPSDGHPPSS